jgi:Raf kinase inhibitor-like YbhB/YbcL family protein
MDIRFTRCPAHAHLRSTMKAIKYTLYTVLALLAAGIALVLLRAAYDRHTDSAFHAGLARTLTVHSDALSPVTDLSADYSCRGRGLSPPLA